MKYILITLALLFLPACFFQVDGDECTYDSDCAYDEACYGGDCKYVPGAPAGAVTVGCNCSTTYYYPGDVRTNYTCESGYDVVQSCGYQCCDAWACYGYAWGAVCL